MGLREIFKFRELPESETSKPFLEHLEDLRWMVVKMAMTLVGAMILCFAFRSDLVRVMQAPLHDLDPQVGGLKALGITDSLVISFHLAFYAGIVISFPLLLYFLAGFCRRRSFSFFATLNLSVGRRPGLCSNIILS